MNLIWCPSIDGEMKGQMDTIIRSFRDMHQERLEGGKNELGAFDPVRDKLYIIAHGHEQMPVFTCNRKSWSADQLVELLKSDGLSTQWGEIELLVCHAGESVNSAQVGNQLLAIRQKLRDKGITKGTGGFKKLEAKFASAASKGQRPGAFVSADQLLPLAAQFTQALKNAGYRRFRVTSYAAPVAQYFGTGRVTLDLTDRKGAFGAELNDHPDLVKVWL